MSSPEPIRPAPGQDAWAAWVRSIAGGDQQALACLYDASSSVVFGMALRILNDRADAEEVALDVYKHVWRCAAAWDSSRGTVVAWLIMLVRSRCVDRIRTRESRQRAEEPVRQENPVTVSDPLLAHQSAVVRKALASLPPEQAELVELAYFSGFSHSELAEKTGLPLGTIKTRLRLALTRLRDLLKEWKP